MIRECCELKFVITHHSIDWIGLGGGIKKMTLQVLPASLKSFFEDEILCQDVEDEEKENANYVKIIVDSTPNGFILCRKFIEEHERANPGFRYYRLKYPFNTRNHLSIADALVKEEEETPPTMLDGLIVDGDDGDEDEDVLTMMDQVIGRIKYNPYGSDFRMYSFEEIKFDREGQQNIPTKQWPVKHTGCWSDIVNNAELGNRILFTRDMFTGLSFIQRLATRLCKRDPKQSLHEVATRITSRLDVSLGRTIIELKGSNRNIFLHQEEELQQQQPSRLVLPTFLFDQDSSGERELVQELTKWMRWRCDSSQVDLIVTDPNRFARFPPKFKLNVGDNFVTNEFHLIKLTNNVEAMLDKWFHLKLDQVVKEKRRKIRSWLDENSLRYHERVFLRTIMLKPRFSEQRELGFNQIEEKEKRLILLSRYSPRIVDHLLNLPVRLLGPEIFDDMSFSIKEGDDEGEGEEEVERKGSAAYCRMSARELFVEELITNTK